MDHFIYQLVTIFFLGYKYISNKNIRHRLRWVFLKTILPSGTHCPVKTVHYYKEFWVIC